MSEMNKKEEFIDRLSQNLTRFHIIDKFNKIDTQVARFKIAEMCYGVLEQMINEAKASDAEIKKAQEVYKQVHEMGVPDVENKENKDSGN